VRLLFIWRSEKKLRDEEYETLEKLQQRVEKRFGETIPETIGRVSEHWIERLDRAIRINGDSISGQFLAYQFHLRGIRA
jgi:uncharacterized alpha-E superfamily protein